MNTTLEYLEDITPKRAREALEAGEATRKQDFDLWASLQAIGGDYDDAIGGNGATGTPLLIAESTGAQVRRTILQYPEGWQWDVALRAAADFAAKSLPLLEGIRFDDRHIVASDGSAMIVLRNPDPFARFTDGATVTADSARRAAKLLRDAKGDKYERIEFDPETLAFVRIDDDEEIARLERLNKRKYPNWRDVLLKLASGEPEDSQSMFDADYLYKIGRATRRFKWRPDHGRSRKTPTRRGIVWTKTQIINGETIVSWSRFDEDPRIKTANEVLLAARTDAQPTFTVVVMGHR